MLSQFNCALNLFFFSSLSFSFLSCPLPLSVLEWEDLAMFLVHSKRVYPDAISLRREGVQVIDVETSAGDVLIVEAGVLHWGMNEAPYSVSLSVNLMTESWLEV